MQRSESEESVAVIPRRIRKFLRDGTSLSVAEIDAALRSGRVARVVRGEAEPIVIGQDAHEVEESLVYPDESILLDGGVVPLRRKGACYLLNKPPGVTTTARDPKGKRDLGSWLEELPAGFFPVGRLDRATTGALLLCNDGDLASAVLRPEHHLAKLYWLWVNDCVPPDDPRLHEWLSGMTIKKQWARADSIEVVTWTKDCTEILVTLSQGINRQVRRMSRKSDFRLLHLHRKSVGPVSVEGLEIGTLKKLGEDELDALWRAVGGRTSVLRAQVEALHARARRLRTEGRPDARLEGWLESEAVDCQHGAGERGLD